MSNQDVKETIYITIWYMDNNWNHYKITRDKAMEIRDLMLDGAKSGFIIGKRLFNKAAIKFVDIEW